jgi:glycerol uptake facilitator-like aquaporin
MAGVLALGPISGAVFNPAVGVLALFAPVHGKKKKEKKKKDVLISSI